MSYHSAGEIKTSFQPIVSLETGIVIGFEALAQIVWPNGAIQPMASAINAIEHDADRLSDLIRGNLTAIAHGMTPLFERYPWFYVSVNVPPIAIGSERIGRMFEELRLTKYLNRFVIEVTERQALTSQGHAILQLARKYGMAVAVDDFGTGHSGLAQIAGFDLDILKIDRSLVVPILTNRISARMIRGIVALSAALHMRTIAEGVENWQQAFFLKAAGVDCGQGWYWSKAVPAEEVEPFLKKGFDHLQTPAPASPFETLT